MIACKQTEKNITTKFGTKSVLLKTVAFVPRL